MKLCVLLLICLSAGFAAELPVRQVVLYKSGVGYFERSGSLGSGESARLDFKASEMNDVLKSLTLTDRSGGKVTGLRYDSSEPLERKLGDFPFQIGTGQPLSAFLDQMKGARVDLKTGTESLSGAIVSGRSIEASDKQPGREQLVLLLDSGDIRTVDLGAVSSLRFADAKLDQRLKDYLTVLSQARAKDKRSVYIDSTDAKSRDLTASYMIPAPVWKSSYRLIFAGAGDPTLEGWAIIDNTTGDDWNNVRLAVVSGRPVSFISRLYEPRYVQRPTAELPEDQTAGPVVYEGGVAGGVSGGVAGGVIGGMLGGVPAPPPPPPVPGMAAPQKRSSAWFQPSAGLSMNRMGPSTTALNSEARDIGDLFEYSFSSPVTVKKDESAMLPFLQERIAARRLLIYQDGDAIHPMNAAELTNSTGKTLDGGPLTVFDAGSYAGEALMETVKSGDKRLISYAVDLGTRIGTKLDSSNDFIREVHVHRGVLITKSAEDETQTYTIRNIDRKPKTLILEHSIRPQFKLLNQKPVETTAGAYRFEVKLPAGGTETFPLKEEHVYEQSTMVSSLNPDVLLTYVQNKALSATAREALQKILDQKNQIADVNRQIERADGELSDAGHDEERVRQNIMSLNRVAGQQDAVQKYAAQLSTLEAKIAATRDGRGELQQKRAALQSGLNSMIEGLDF